MITEEVLRALGPGAGAGAPRLLIILTGSLAGNDAVVPVLQAIAELPLRSAVLLSPNAEDQSSSLLSCVGLPLLGRAEVHDRRLETVRQYDLFCVPALTMNTLAKVATGVRDGLVTDLLAWILLSGKPLLVARDSIGASPADLAALGAREIAPPYRRLIERRLKEIQELGATVLSLDQLPAALRKLSAPSTTAPRAVLVRPGRRRVVSADELERFTGATFILEPGAIVTPLARDVAIRRQIAFRAADD